MKDEEKRRGSRLLLFALQLAFLVVLVRMIDRDQMTTGIRDVGTTGVLLFIGGMGITRWLTAWRWTHIARRHLGLESVKIPFIFQTSLLAEFAGIWFQSFVGGEAVRIWKVGRRTGDTKRATGSVVLDRSVGTVSLLLCILFLLPFVARKLPIHEIRAAYESWMGWSLILALAIPLFAWWKLPLFQSLVQSAWSFLRASRFLAVPTLISIAIYPVMVAAHRLAFDELAIQSWIIACAVVLLPRLGRIVPLSAFGITAVEGSTLVIGKMFGLSQETLLSMVALNVADKYLASTCGLAIELSRHGLLTWRELTKRTLETDDFP